MSAHKDAVASYFEGFGTGDHDRILALLTDDVVWDLPGFRHLAGKEEFDSEIENPAFEGHPKLDVDRMVEEGDTVVAIGSGAYYSLALKADGQLAGWGDNGYGQLNFPAAATNVVAIAAGGYHALALKGNGRVVAWGHNGVFQSDVPPGLSNVIAEAAGENHSVALKADGTLAAWGHNAYGQTTVPAGLGSVIGIAALIAPRTRHGRHASRSSPSARPSPSRYAR